MAKKTPTTEALVETNPVVSPEPVPQTDAPDAPASPNTAADPITFAEPPAEVDPSKAVFSDDAHAPLISQEQMDALRLEAGRDNDQRDFTLKVLAARAPVVEDAAPPPVADRVRSQTEAEMAAGRKMNEHYEALHAKHGRPRPEPEGSKPVFRPGDYVPDPKKGQGIVPSRNL